MDDYGSPRSFQLVGLFTTDAWEIVWASRLLPAVWRMWSQTTLPGSPRASHCLSRFQCLDYWLVFLASGGWLFSTRTAAARFHLAWMLYPEWLPWFQPREHLWDRVACMSDARGATTLKFVDLVVWCPTRHRYVFGERHPSDWDRRRAGQHVDSDGTWLGPA